ncbi:MAG TPA: orotidine-5'-phosphate decarboxylase [Pyrinomonadaceae bacterium]|nr:orotidine-5'-phosphate decarboxylase [Pyrinomonadaceae bacterium]
MKAKDRLIAALDVTTADEALKLVNQLDGQVGMFKVGSQLFTSTGPRIVEEIIRQGNKVFLDLKFHDIPHQVSGAIRSATELRVSMLTIHASGGTEMMRRAAETAKQVAERAGIAPPAVVAVTILTSLDSNLLNQVGFADDATASVKRLASLAALSGVDGVVASPREITTIRSTVADRDFLVVIPGIRPAVSTTDAPTTTDDQKRVATPAFAVAEGASYLVVGRPITAAPDPARAAQQIVAEMEVRAVSM